MAWEHLTDKQWDAIECHLPHRKCNRKGGRHFASDRKCFEGILWILRTGSQWKEIPAIYGSKSTVHRRLCQWAEDGTLLKLWRWFLEEISDHQKIQWSECFVDGTFASAKKGGPLSGKPDGEKERSLWYWQMAVVLRSEFSWRLPPKQK